VAARMSFWQENYSFIKEVYDTRVAKMIEWMDQLEMAIGKVMATKVYTSNEFRRERDNFLSLCKNLERTETKKWLREVMEVLFKDRNSDEKKEETGRLETVMERHLTLIPRVKETQVKSEVFWKCYEYGDDLVQIFEFIDDQRAKSVRDIVIPDSETTEEMIDKHGSIVRMMESKRKTVEEFIKKGEALMEDPKSPKFLEAHVSKLKDAWDAANEEAIKRKVALGDNLDAWKNFEEKRLECGRCLDMADNELKGLKKNFNMDRAPQELQEKLKVAANMRLEIDELFSETETAAACLCMFAPDDKKTELEAGVTGLRERLGVLANIDTTLQDLEVFNQELKQFDETLTELDVWINGRAQEKIGVLRAPDSSSSPPDPEDRVTKAMELMEDMGKRTVLCTKAEQKKEDIFPPEGKKVSREAKEFMERMKTCRNSLTKLEDEVTTELNRFSQDVKYFADFQCGVRSFLPWLVLAEERVKVGLSIPGDLVSACGLLGDCKSFQDDCEKKIKTIDNAQNSASQMTLKIFALNNIEAFRKRYEALHLVAVSWVGRLASLVECWNGLDGKIVELSSWVQAPESQEDASGISIERLESQLQLLKNTFKEKEEMLETLKVSCGPVALYPSLEEPEKGEGKEELTSQTENEDAAGKSDLESQTSVEH